MLRAENYKRGEVTTIEAVDAPVATTILDHDRGFWRGYVAGDGLDSERLQAAGYSEAQIPWLESEMRKLGWL